MKDRTKRLKALGNAVVPQCAQWIGERIMQIEYFDSKGSSR
jgi:site-specific DNA-cytosine methylase